MNKQKDQYGQAQQEEVSHSVASAGFDVVHAHSFCPLH